MRHPSADKRKAEIQGMELPYDVQYGGGITIRINNHNIFPPGIVSQEFCRLIQQGRIDFNEKSVLDLGCGCGIISILAAKAGAKKVVAVDIVKDCVNATLQNAMMNNVEIDARQSNGLNEISEDERFDIIVFIAPQDNAEPEDDLDHAFYDPFYALINSLAEKARNHLNSEGVILQSYMDHNKEARPIQKVFEGSASRELARVGPDVSLYEISYPDNLKGPSCP